MNITALAPYIKFYAALIGSICTAALGSFGPDTTVGKILTLGVAIATALAVFQLPNLPAVVDPLDEPIGDPNADVDRP